MRLSEKIKKAIEVQPQITAALKGKTNGGNWATFTRTQFNIIARCINRQVTKEFLSDTDLAEMNLIIGRQNLEKQLKLLRCNNLYELAGYLSSASEYRVFNWISGKTLQSYWNNGEAKYVKINTLLVFLNVPFNEWDTWQKEPQNAKYVEAISKTPMATGFSKTSIAIVKSYYLGNYYLYYQKTDGSKNIIKTPFVLKELENGQIQIKSVSEGHRYKGKLLGIRDGCLYINCQNLDFEEMEQYIFNIGLETKPQVLFGVSNTVSVKNRQAVALKNILVKQKNTDSSFENIPEIEIPFTKKYSYQSEEAIVLEYLKQSNNNLILTPNCCTIEDMKEMIKH